MKGLESGKDKVKKICDILRKETLEPAQDEARGLIESAKEQAQQLIEEAKQEAERLKAEALKHNEQERGGVEEGIAKTGERFAVWIWGHRMHRPIQYNPLTRILLKASLKGSRTLTK